MSLSLNGTHAESGNYEYDVHSLYGHMMAEHSYNFLSTNAAYDNFIHRPFILTRSTFAGSGRFAGHWLGDNMRNYEAMTYSISGIMNF